MSDAEPQQPKLAVVMCTFKRIPDLLSKTLDMLKEQTDLGFDLYLWNNNPDIPDLRPFFAPAHHYPFRIMCHSSPTNVGGIGRFYQTRSIAHLYPYVVFIDDDQQFDRHMIETFRREARPGLICGWWAHKILGSYTQRKRCLPGQDADYIGTGGMICPSEIFTRQKLFDDLPAPYVFIEDLWLSYFAKYECRYALRRSAVNIGFVPFEESRNQHHQLVHKKIEFQKYLHRKYRVA